MSREWIQAAALVGRAFQQVEQAARPIEAAETALVTLREVERFAGPVDDLGPARHLLGRYGERRPPRSATERLLLNLEGRLIGRAVRERLPEAIQGHLAALIDGRGDLSRDSIDEASRWIRRDFILPLTAEAGIRPAGRIHRHVRWTPLQPFPALSGILGRPVLLKREDLQPVGSFKLRGATFRLLLALLMGVDPKKVAVITVSHGNHAQGVVQAAHNLGFRRVTVYLPVNASPLKIAQLKALGAEVRLTGHTFEKAEEEARRVVAKDPAGNIFVHAYNDGGVIRGQGTMGREIRLQLQRRGFRRGDLIIPAGGGGMLAGVGAYLEPDGFGVWGAEAMADPYVSLLVRNGRVIVPTDLDHHVLTSTDGIALKRPGEVGAPHILRHVRDVVAITEREVEAAIAWLHQQRIPVEGAAAVPIGALLGGGLVLEDSTDPVVFVVSGRNIDPPLLEEILRRQGSEPLIYLKTTATARSDLEGHLTDTGFLSQGRLRPLPTAGDGIRFVSAVAAAPLPRGYDLIDRLELLFHAFPEWEEEVHGVIKTLRSLAMYQTRWNVKYRAVNHPYSNRATTLTMTVEMATRDGDRRLLANQYWPVQRLLVENAVVNLCLTNLLWFRQLHSRDTTPAEMVRMFRGLEYARRLTVEAIRGLARLLGIDVGRLATITEAEYLALVSTR